jgi:hypothetical protein
MHATVTTLKTMIEYDRNRRKRETLFDVQNNILYVESWDKCGSLLMDQRNLNSFLSQIPFKPCLADFSVIEVV